MISPAVAAAQLERVASMPGYPRDNDAAQQDLLDALRRASSSDEHCKEIIDGWVESSRYAPAVADLYDLGNRTRTEPVNKCPVCDGTTWVITKQRINEDEVEVADRCPQCFSGRAPTHALKVIDRKFTEKSNELIKQLANAKGMR